MSGSTFFDALTDPGVSALIGAAQGFGQAAMPQRMPVPIGAVLGMGGGGALQGLQTGQALQKSGIENQRARMLMDWYKSNYGGGAGAGGGSGSAFGAPAAGANGMYLRSPQQIAGMGDLAMATGQDRSAATLYGLPNTMAGGAGYAMGPDGRGFAVPGGAADPSVVGTKAAAEAFGKGAGGAPYVPPIKVNVPNGHGGFDERTMTPQQATAVATGGAAPNADPFPAWATRINGNENGTGNPAARNPSSTATGNGQFLDGTWPTVIRAVRPDLAAGKTDAQLLPLRAVPELAQSATEQYARMNGAALANGGLPVNGGTVALAHFLGPQGAATVLRAQPNAPIEMLPGMTPVVKANPQLRGVTAGGLVQQYQGRMGGAPAATPSQTTNYPPAGAAAPMPGIPGLPVLTPQQESELKIQTAGASAGAEQANKIIQDREGNLSQIDPRTGRVIYYGRGSGIKPVVDPNSGQATHGDVGAIGIGTLRPGVPTQMVGPDAATLTEPAPQIAHIPPDVQAARSELVKEFHGKDADAYQAAQNTQGWLNQIDHAADVMNKAGSNYGTGPFAPQRLAAMGAINDAARSIGLKSLFNENAIASAEEMHKATTTAGFELSSHYEGHARQAAATIMNATSAVPGMSNSPRGVQLVSAGIHEGAQSAMDAHEYKQARYNGTDPYGINPSANGKAAGAGLETAETDFYKKFPASMYSERAISMVQPPKLTAKDLPDFERQAEKYLPGTQVILNGVPKTIPARPNAPAIPAYIQQRFTQNGR